MTRGTWAMRLAILAGLFALGAAIYALSGTGEKPGTTTRDATAVSGDGASPIETYKKRVVREAMAGLSYDSGRVELDRANAPELDRLGDAAAARERREAGYASLDDHNNFLGAIRHFTDAVLTDPENAESYAGLGLALFWKGKVDEAEAALRSALDLDASLPEPRALLASLLNGSGRRDAGIEQWRVVLEVVDEDPSDEHAAIRTEAHERLATALYYAGDVEGAREQVELAERRGGVIAEPFRALLAAASQGAISVPKLPVVERASGSVGPQVRADVGAGTEASNETSIATTSMDPDEVVAVWNDWRRSTGSEVINMGVGVSLDGGSTWTDFLVRPPAPNQSGVEGDPMTAYDHRTGTLWVGAISFAGNGGLYVAKKVQGSTSFEPSVQVGQISFADKCWMVAGPRNGNPNETNVYIAYNEGVWRSTDMGATWQGPVSVPSGIGFLPRIAPNGDLYVSYWDFGSGHWLLRSTNGGLSFSGPFRIATRMDVWGTQDGSRFPGRFRVPAFNVLAIDPTNSNLYAIYPDTTSTSGGNAQVDLYFTKSTNGGTTWSTPDAIDFDGIRDGDQLFPFIECDDQGVIHLVFYDTQNTVQNDDDPNGFFDAYYASSTDEGASWKKTRLTSAPFNSINDGLDRGSSQFIGDYSGVAYGGTRAYVCYLSTQNGDADIFVHAIDTDDGTPTLSNPDPGTIGSNSSMTASGIDPGATVEFYAAKRTDGTKVIPQCPMDSLPLRNPKFLGSGVANGSGDATVSFNVPPRASGLNIIFQAIDVTNCVPTEQIMFLFP